MHPHIAPALRTTSKHRRRRAQPQLTALRHTGMITKREATILPNSSTSVHTHNQRPHRTTLMRKPSDQAKRRDRKALINGGAEGVRTSDPHTDSDQAVSDPAGVLIISLTFSVNSTTRLW